jgi:hypothetical protein
MQKDKKLLAKTPKCPTVFVFSKKIQVVFLQTNLAL